MTAFLKCICGAYRHLNFNHVAGQVTLECPRCGMKEGVSR